MSKTKVKKEKKEQATAPATITLANIARDVCDKNPRTVRMRFRKLYAEGKDTSALPQPVSGASRWTFKASDQDALVALIGVNAAGE